MSERHLRRKLAAVILPEMHRTVPSQPIVVVMDTTYFDSYGVMVFRDPHAKHNLLWYFMNKETNLDYLQGLRELQQKGYHIAAVVCDGKKWLCQQVSWHFPVQHCQFHLMKTVTRYLTRHPELPAGQELRWIVLQLIRATEKEFINALQRWHQRWQIFLQEKTSDPFSKHWHYTHRRTRGAYAAICHALPYLFTCERYPHFHIPNTTNTLDGSFSQLKQKIHVHRGLNALTQQKMITTILMYSKPKREIKKKPTENVH